MLSKLHCLAFSLCLPVLAQQNAKPSQLCAWIIETRHEDVEHFDLWLQADRELEFLWVVGGEGVVNGSGKSHSPSSGSYVLRPGKAEKPWGFGTTINAPARVDITVEARQKPADIFSKNETPLLAKFVFRRAVPESKNPLRPPSRPSSAAQLNSSR